MKRDLDIKFSVIKKPKMWVFQVDSAEDMDDQMGLMALMISAFKFAESLGVDKEVLAEAILENMDSDTIDAVVMMRELPRGDA
jgi:hypothetical protein